MIIECPVTVEKCVRNCIKICEFDEVAKEIAPLLASIATSKKVEDAKPFAQKIIARLDAMGLDVETSNKILFRGIQEAQIRAGKILGFTDLDISNMLSSD